MRFSILLYLVPAALCAAASPSPANVTISNAATANMTCSGGVCSPTATDAVLNVQDLEAMLASGNATVTTTSSGIQAVNIDVKARLSWSAATTLALDAFHSIELNAKVSVAGIGGVSLTTNDGGSGGDFACNGNGRVEFSSLSSTLTINGTPYVLVNSVAALAAAIAANPSGAYALAKNYNAKKDGIYMSSPVATIFTGSFNGLGNSISNLSINDPTQNSYVGLFAETGNGSAISNIQLVGETVQGSSGSSGGSSTEYIGGLVGYASAGLITHSFTGGSVSGGDNAAVGGLIGVGGSTIAASGSAATVSDGATGNAGGLIGLTNSGRINDSWATGNVSGSIFVGGLVGFNSSAAVEHSWAGGSVSSTDPSAYVGGLEGTNQSGIIERSHASGNVNCVSICGGLVAYQGCGCSTVPKILQSFATGNVSAVDVDASGAGGLVAYNNFGEIVNSYSTGAVSAWSAGGLIGDNENFSGYHTIQDSYATGAVSGRYRAYTGGLIGFDDYASTIRHTYWDRTTSGITDPSQGAGNVANDSGIKGLSDAKLKAGLPNGFNPKIWKEDSSINGGLPYLINNPPVN